VEIRRIRPEEWRRLRDLRLAALVDAPDAFAATLAQERERPDAEWRRWAHDGSVGSSEVTFIAASGDAWAGLAIGFFHPGRPDTVVVGAMWVAPRARRRGAARQLLEAVAGWASGAGAARVELWVTDGNEAAATLYRAAGFRPAGERQPLASNPTLSQTLLERPC